MRANGIPAAATTRRFEQVAKILYAVGAVAAIGASAVGGLAVDASNSSTTTTTPAAVTTTATTTAATSNEDATHEAGESAAREAEENAGGAGFGHRGDWNTDPAHEAA